MRRKPSKVKKRVRRTKARMQGLRRMTLREAADEFGVSPETLRRKLARQEIPSGQGVTFTVQQIHKVLSGDIAFEQLREAKGRADRLEIENQKALGLLIDRDDVANFIRLTFAPVREQSISMPGILAPQVNPADPQHAQSILQRWVELFLKTCREHIPPAPKEVR